MTTEETTKAERITVKTAPTRKRGRQGNRVMRGGTQKQAQRFDAQVVDPLLLEARNAFQAKKTVLAELRAMQVLQHAPNLVEALVILYRCKRQARTPDPQLEGLLRRIVDAAPNLLWAVSDLAFMLFSRGERVECEVHARAAIRLAPRNARAHGIMGLILSETNRAPAGEYHFRKVIELTGENSRVATNLANCLKSMGKMEEAESWYKRATELDPKYVEAWLGWCRLKEVDRDIPRAWELLFEAEKASENVDTRMTRAILLGRENKTEEALAELTLSKNEGEEQKSLTAVALFERGRLYDKLNRFDEAWADYVEANRLCREVQGRKYHDQLAKNHIDRLKSFYTRNRMSILPRARVRSDVPQPIFVVGFPRSGTTMVEQTITAHPLISAGDELIFISDLTRIGPRLLGSPLQFPECLADLWMGDNVFALDQFRDYFLSRSEQLGLFEDGAKFFTDKMPLNETHLGLIHMVFPESPIIYIRRHPLDILTSNFANFLTHGFNQSFGFRTCATHQARIDDLMEHYKKELDLKYLEVRYEDLVENQEARVREMLDFIGVEFDPKCLSFHENQRYARTASYAQVAEKLYDNSVYRFRNYRKHLDDAVDTLRPMLERLNYPTA